MFHGMMERMFSLRGLLGLLGVFSLLAGAGAQTPVRKGELWQTHFSVENAAVRKPVPIPDEVFAILKNADAAKRFEDDGKTPAEPQRSWFSAAVVHLQDATKNDLVVVAEAPIVGANVSTFWVFLDTPEGMKLALTAPVHDLFIRPPRWKGVRTIELDSMTCCVISTTLLRYENGQFREYRQLSKEIR